MNQQPHALKSLINIIIGLKGKTTPSRFIVSYFIVLKNAWVQEAEIVATLTRELNELTCFKWIL